MSGLRLIYCVLKIELLNLPEFGQECTCGCGSLVHIRWYCKQMGTSYFQAISESCTTQTQSCWCCLGKSSIRDDCSCNCPSFGVHRSVCNRENCRVAGKSAKRECICNDCFHSRRGKCSNLKDFTLLCVFMLCTLLFANVNIVFLEEK